MEKSYKIEEKGSETWNLPKHRYFITTRKKMAARGKKEEVNEKKRLRPDTMLLFTYS